MNHETTDQGEAQAPTLNNQEQNIEQSDLEQIRLGNRVMEEGRLKLDTLREAQRTDPAFADIYYSDNKPKNYKMRSNLLIHGDEDKERWPEAERWIYNSIVTI